MGANASFVIYLWCLPICSLWKFKDIQEGRRDDWFSKDNFSQWTKANINKVKHPETCWLNLPNWQDASDTKCKGIILVHKIEELLENVVGWVHCAFCFVLIWFWFVLFSVCDFCSLLYLYGGFSDFFLRLFSCRFLKFLFNVLPFISSFLNWFFIFTESFSQIRNNHFLKCKIVNLKQPIEWEKKMWTM